MVQLNASPRGVGPPWRSALLTAHDPGALPELMFSIPCEGREQA